MTEAHEHVDDAPSSIDPQSQTPPARPAAAAPPAPPLPNAYGPAASSGADIHPARRRRPAFAAFLSILPGFGNVYNGLFYRGLLTFLVFFSLVFTTAESGDGPQLAILVPAMIFTWLFGVVDAYRQATLINYGITEASLGTTETSFRAPSGNLAVGVALFVIGLYGLLNQVFDIDLSVLLDYWYVLIMAFGGWMIYQSLQARKAVEEAAGLDTETGI
jgi:hypothetical protein